MTQCLSLSRVTLYKNNLAFAERQGSLTQSSASGSADEGVKRWQGLLVTWRMRP